MVGVKVEAFLALSERERDTVVAEKVMAWTKVEYFPNDDRGPYSDCANGLRPDGVYTAVPIYTTDETAVGRVVDHLVTEGFSYYLGYQQQRRRWDATFDSTRCEAFAQTRPLAICLAALKVVGAIE